MDVEEAVKEKEQLEDDIKKLILDYEIRTHARVTDIDIQTAVTYSPAYINRLITADLSLRLTVEI